MHCKQAGSAILKISLFEFNSNTSVMKICSVVHYFLLSFNGTNICDLIISQTYVVITCFWRVMGYVVFTRFCRESGFIANTRFFGCLVQTFTQTLRILLRFCADICPKNWPLGPLA